VNDTVGYTDSVTLYNGEYTPGYAADIDFSGISSHNATMDISATVYDAAGNPAADVPCMLYIPLTSEGRPGVVDGGDSWLFYEYGGDNDMGDYASYLGSWLGDNATVTDEFGQLNATITTASFLADVDMTVQFGVGGTGVAAGFNYSANNFWLEWPGPGYSTPPLTDDADVYYWLAAGFTMIDQAILKRAPLVTLTKATLSQPFLSSADNKSTISLTFQDLAGVLSAKKVNIGLGTAKPVILNTNTTSTVGVYTYDYTAKPQSFDGGFGFTSVVKDAGYAKFPFNFYFPYLADGITAKTMVVTVKPVASNIVMGQNIALEVKVTDEYGRIVTGASVVSGTQTTTTNANGTAQLTISTASQTKTGIYTMLLDVTKGTLSTKESASVILISAEPKMISIIIGPVLDKDSEPIEGALVSVSLGATGTRQATTYSGLTNTTGYATIEVPETFLNQLVNVTITKEGYETVTYTTTLNSNGTLAVAPPTVNTVEDGGIGMGLIAGIAIAILVVVLLVILVVMPKMKAGKAAESAAPKPEPKEVDEPKKPEEPVEEVLTKEAAPEELTPEKPE
jgi:hypothetical protein